MTLGKREYSEAELKRMQRDAEERVREMQNRARQTVEHDNTSSGQAPRNRNWNSGSGMRRPNNHRPQGQPPKPAEAPREEEKPREEPQAEPQPEKKATTVIEDIMGALSIDEDYLLIVGLILILVNQRADTTLILALAYLLI